VNEEATIMEIKSAYRKMARKIHPDHNGSTEAMARLNEAYAYLVEDQNGQ
jgi:DnaJ-class molecular chaperone